MVRQRGQRAGPVGCQIIQPEDVSGRRREEVFREDGQESKVGDLDGDKEPPYLQGLEKGFYDFPEGQVFRSADFVDLIAGVVVIQGPDQGGGQVLDPQGLEQRIPVPGQEKHEGDKFKQFCQSSGEVVVLAVDHCAAEDGGIQAAFPDALFGDRLGGHHRKGGCPIRAQMAEVEKPVHTGIFRGFKQRFRALDIRLQ